MDQRVAAWFFFGGIVLVLSGIYGSSVMIPDPTAGSSLLPWGKDVGMQILGTVLAVIGAFGMVHSHEPGEEF
jgi:hypothetical protein